MNYIVTLVDRNEDFIELQYKTIKKFFISKIPFEYIVFNNAGDKKRKNNINKICFRLGIRCVDVPSQEFYSPQKEKLSLKLMIRKIKKHKNPFILRDLYSDPSEIVSDSLNYIWNNYLKFLDGNLFWMDSDMFFVDYFDIQKEMNNIDVLYSPQYVGKNLDTEYMWAGLYCLNLDKVHKNLDFSLGMVEDAQTDTGGYTHYFLKDKNYKKGYLTWDQLNSIKENVLEVNLDGRSKIEFTNGKVTFRQIMGINKIFPYEKNDSNYFKNMFIRYNKHREIADKYRFPQPYCFDLFRVYNSENFFMFHFRSSNWSKDLYGDGNNDYMKDKKEALKRMIDDLVRNEKM